MLFTGEGGRVAARKIVRDNTKFFIARYHCQSLTSYWVTAIIARTWRASRLSDYRPCKRLRSYLSACFG